MINNFFEAVKELDGFAHNQFLRYRSEDNYRTLLGGCITISIVIIFLGIFSTMIIGTVTSQIISSSDTRIFQINPSPYVIQIGDKSKFHMAFGIEKVNVTGDKRFFDIYFEQRIFNITEQDANNRIKRERLPLIPCQKSSWSGISSQVDQAYDSLRISNMLCLQNKQTIDLEGRWSSLSMKYGHLAVSKCVQNQTLFPNTTCANSSQISQFIQKNGDFIGKFYFINTIANKDSQNYLGYYIQENNWMYFNLLNGITSDVRISEFEIQTDHSLFPWSIPSTDDGIFIQNVFIPSQRITVINDNYFQLNILKNDFRIQGKRSFQKIDATLSYIGGLYGAVLILFIFIGLYSKYCYEIQFGDRIFKKNDTSSYGSEGFNFITYVGYGIFNIFIKLGFNLKWKKMRQYHECRMESLKQLDINLLFKKVEFFQQIAALVLEQHHLLGIHMLPKRTIKQAKANRMGYLFQSKMYRQIDKKSKGLNIENEEYKKRYIQFVKEQQHNIKKYLGITIEELKEDEKNSKNNINFAMKSIKKIESTSQGGDYRSKKLWQKIKKTPFTQLIYNIFDLAVVLKESLNNNNIIINDQIKQKQIGESAQQIIKMDLIKSNSFL